MKLLHAERNGEAFDSQLVIGVRESYGKLKTFDRVSILQWFSQKLLSQRLILSVETSKENSL